MTEKYCKKCGVLIEKSWSNYSRRLYCLWHSTGNKDKHFFSPRKEKRKIKKPTKIDLTIDKLSVDYDRMEKARSGYMYQLWLQEYIERHR